MGVEKGVVRTGVVSTYATREKDCLCVLLAPREIADVGTVKEEAHCSSLRAELAARSMCSILTFKA